MKAEGPDDAGEAKTEAQRRSLQAAVVAIEMYLATKAGKVERAKRVQTHESLDANGID
jgi:hypothetical protein